ncbi:unnamed protein product, partial [Choristocarpus tenellus]
SIATKSKWVWTTAGMDPNLVFHGKGALPIHSEYIKPSMLNHELPVDGKPEVAFSGRSNAGKSTLIGALIKNINIVRTSKEAGCTKTVNYFGMRNSPNSPFSAYLVDLPGYGFARQSRSTVRQWTNAVRNYLVLRPPTVLRRTFLLVDVRHGLQAGDMKMMKLLDEAAVTYQVVLTKVDKVTDIELVQAVEEVCRSVARNHLACFPVVHCISAKKGSGMSDFTDSLCYIMGQ